LKIRGAEEAPGTPRTLLSEGEEPQRSGGEGSPPENLKAAACRKLAIDAERHLKNPRLALEYLNLALAFLKNKSTIQEDMIRRREKLLKKLDDCGGIP
jgi:hypothetical protein